MSDLSSPEKSVSPGDESKKGGNAIGLVGVDADAINVLNTAIGGVRLLDEVVTHIKSAAAAVDTASGNAVTAVDIARVNAVMEINMHVEVNAKKRIDELAVSAVKSAVKAYQTLWAKFDNFLGEG